MPHCVEIRPAVDELRVTGRLVDDAHLAYTTDKEPHAVLSLEIEPAIGLPYRVRQDLGNDPTVHFEWSMKARTLSRGALVRVTAKGVRVQSDFGKAGLRLLDVTDVSLAPTHTPQED